MMRVPEVPANYWNIPFKLMVIITCLGLNLYVVKKCFGLSRKEFVVCYFLSIQAISDQYHEHRVTTSIEYKNSSDVAFPFFSICPDFGYAFKQNELENCGMESWMDVVDLKYPWQNCSSSRSVYDKVMSLNDTIYKMN